MERQGYPGNVLVQVGEFSALPHGSPRPQPIREGTMVMVDDGCSVEGYVSDITRTVVLGKPTDKMRKVWDMVPKAQSAALAAKPGVSCESVDVAARKAVGRRRLRSGLHVLHPSTGTWHRHGWP
jgi:Xaa-Pro dipeptidase